MKPLHDVNPSDDPRIGPTTPIRMPVRPLANRVKQSWSAIVHIYTAESLVTSRRRNGRPI